MNDIKPSGAIPISPDVKATAADVGKAVGGSVSAQSGGNTVPTDISDAAAVSLQEGVTRVEAQELPDSEEQRAKIEQAVAQLNEYLQSVQRTLHFSLDDGTGQTVITVSDRSSNEVIRQIPSDLALELAQKLSDQEPLLLFSAQV